MKIVALLASIVAFSATAETIAVATAPDGSSIVLTDERGPCVGDARLALWISADARVKVPGCYVAFPQVVMVSFLDGDRGDIPIQALKKPTGL